MRSLDDLCESLRSTDTVRLIGTGRRLSFLPAWDKATISVSSLSGVVSHDIDDQVIEVWAGTPVDELQSVLKPRGQCLPLVSGLPSVVAQEYGTVGGLLAMNLPHALSAQCGGPRDWTLGMTVVRTDGTSAKCGSKAVKSVAGYDVHKLFVGSRGTLGAIAKVTLRTFPLRALPDHQVEVIEDSEPLYVSRTLRTEFDRTRAETGRLVAVDQASCTLWSLDEPRLHEGAWMIGPQGKIARQLQPQKFEARAYTVFDPSSKLAPGWQE